jgi:hypothetical protein
MYFALVALQSGSSSEGIKLHYYRLDKRVVRKELIAGIQSFVDVFPGQSGIGGDVSSYKYYLLYCKKII